MIKLGIIGLSEGNGHPYSWSAIFNGYDNKLIKNCPFPAIPEYLNMQIWPNACISNAKVVSILTQDFNLSKNIAEMTYIPHISENIAEMINKVDAILLARDDAENHIYYAEPTIMANKAIYIDKPIALNMNQFDKIYSLERYYGQIFTCSALRYSKEMELSNEDFKELGEIKKINAYTPKSWNKYAVHIIEPVYKILLKLNHTIPTFSKLEDIGNGGTRLSVIWNEKIETIFTTLGNLNSDIYIEIFGINGIKILTFKDSFTAFKYSLENFIEGVYLKQCNSPKEFNKKIVQIIELGVT